MSKAQPTLQVLHQDRTIFSSFGKWLHPLFEFEEWLKGEDIDPKDLTLCDNIVGKAAALLIVRLQIRRVKAGVLSKLGEGVLKSHQVSYSYAEMVDRVLCQTEQMLQDIEDLDEAHGLLKKRAKKD